MTDIQIRYWDYREQARHNLATEELSRETLSENMRANRANEAISIERNQIQREYNLGYLSEMSYHNRMTENENKRHNIASEGIQKLQAQASMLSASAAMAHSRAYQQSVNADVALKNEQIKSAAAAAQMAQAEAASPYNSTLGVAVRQAFDIFTSGVGALTGATNAIGNVWRSQAAQSDAKIRRQQFEADQSWVNPLSN